MTTLARIQVAKTHLEIAKVDGHYAKQRREHLPPVVTAWLLLLLGAGGSCGLIRWDQKRHRDGMELATNIKKPSKLDPTHKDCTNCPARCGCKVGKCDCPAQTEDARKPIRADVLIPPNTDTAISAFGHPWASADRL